MDLSASLPRESERIDMRYQWISRLLGNALIDTDRVMAPFASEVLQRATANGRRLILIIDQSKANDTPQAIGGLEAMFSDFKSRGFGLEDSQLQRTDRMDRLILVMSLALNWAVSTGRWASENAALPIEKNARAASEKGGSQPDILLQARPAPHSDLSAGHLRAAGAVVGLEKLTDGEDATCSTLPSILRSNTASLR